MAAVAVRVVCACGAGSTWSATDDRAWGCPSCARRWAPERDALGRVTRAAEDLRRLRRLVLVATVSTVVIAAALVAAHPQWALGIPAAVGGVLLGLQPTYRKRRARAVALLAGGIPLHASQENETLP